MEPANLFGGQASVPSPRHFDDYRDFLLACFERIRATDLVLSQGEFARQLGMRPSRLSEILSRKQGLSKKWALAIARRLGLPEPETASFVDLVRSAHARSHAERRLAEARVQSTRKNIQHRPLSAEAFSSISSWHHLALFELLQEAPHTSARLSERLRLPGARVTESLRRLKRLGLVSFSAGVWSATDKPLEVASDVPSEAIRNFHRQMGQKAAAALSGISHLEREFVSLLLRANPERLPWVREKIAEFVRTLEKELENDEGRSTLYALGIHWFPLSS